MGRTLEQVMAELPAPRRDQVHASYLELKQDVENLRELRLITGKAQADIATSLKIKQPSVSRMEKQADIYLSTLKTYIEAVGGRLELIVMLPDRPPIRLNQLGDLSPSDTSDTPSLLDPR